MLADGDWWVHIHPSYMLGMAFVATILIVSVVSVVAHYVHLMKRTRYENYLKRGMLERGMSAEEIERVIRASADPDDK